MKKERRQTARMKGMLRMRLIGIIQDNNRKLSQKMKSK